MNHFSSPAVNLKNLLFVDLGFISLSNCPSSSLRFCSSDNDERIAANPWGVC